MKTLKYTLFAMLIALIISSCSIFSSLNRKMMNIEKGMTKTEIKYMLGNPDYRNFDSDKEEWVYVEPDKDLIVGFYNERVESMTTLPPNSYKYRSSYQNNEYSPYSATYSNYSQPKMSSIIREKEFQDFLNTVNTRISRDDKMAEIKSEVYNRSFTCTQCVRMMNLFTLDNDKLQVFSIMAPNIADWENQTLILDNFKFISTREKAQQTIDNILRR
ncbi:MAG: DUF4476 domain-containing protein [Paludibacteraceae bacterium]